MRSLRLRRCASRTVGVEEKASATPAVHWYEPLAECAVHVLVREARELVTLNPKPRKAVSAAGDPCGVAPRADVVEVDEHLKAPTTPIMVPLARLAATQARRESNARHDAYIPLQA